MSANASHAPSLQKAAASNRNFIMTALADVCMIPLARFVLDGTIAGMLGVWSISFVGVAVGGCLSLRF